MKAVVLLALTGLASCRTTLIGGNRARDVIIKYSYLDQNGKIVEVEMEADRLGLQLTDLLPAPTPARFVLLEAPPSPPQPAISKRLVQVAPAPTPAIYTRSIEVVPVAPAVPAAPVAPQPQVTRYVKVDLDDDDNDIKEYRPVRIVVAAPKPVGITAMRTPAPAEDDRAEK